MSCSDCSSLCSGCAGSCYGSCVGACSGTMTGVNNTCIKKEEFTESIIENIKTKSLTQKELNRLDKLEKEKIFKS